MQNFDEVFSHLRQYAVIVKGDKVTFIYPLDIHVDFNLIKQYALIYDGSIKDGHCGLTLQFKGHEVAEYFAVPDTPVSKMIAKTWYRITPAPMPDHLQPVYFIHSQNEICLGQFLRHDHLLRRNSFRDFLNNVTYEAAQVSYWAPINLPEFPAD